ncbi:MAG: hypothetical protein Q8P41_17545 [Pseudomonadota bacterium]|nr:hypothetical protein [Pseudomonadota bacterium]
MIPRPVSVRVAHYALLSGLAALVPLPILDDWLRRRGHRAMYATLAEEAGTPLGPETLDALTEDRSSLLYGCLGIVVFWPLKKLFRTVLYFLTVKDVLDGAAEATLRAAMLREALPRLPDDARAVRDVMDATLDRAQYSPVSRWFFRGHRPDAEWVAGVDRVDRSVAWLYKKAGGGVILAEFIRRLAAYSPPSERIK